MKVKKSVLIISLGFASPISFAAEPSSIRSGQSIQAPSGQNRGNESSPFMTQVTFQKIVGEIEQVLKQTNSSLVENEKNPLTFGLSTVNRTNIGENLRDNKEVPNRQEISIRGDSIRFVLDFTPYSQQATSNIWGFVDLKIFVSTTDQAKGLEAERMLKAVAQRAGVFDPYMRVIDVGRKGIGTGVGIEMTLTPPTYEYALPFLDHAKALVWEMTKLQLAETPEAYLKSYHRSCLRLLN